MREAIDLGFVTVTPWHLANSIAIATAGLTSLWRLQRAGYPRSLIIRGMVLTIAVGVAGTAAAYFIVGLTDGFIKQGVWRPTVSGSTIIGALVAGSLTAYGLCRWHGISPGRALDAGLVPVPLGQAIGRIGCFLAPCCTGRPTDSWLGMMLPDGAGMWARRYPSQLMASFFDLLIFAALLLVERRAGGLRHSAPGLPFPGFLTLLFLGLYCVKRFALEFTRTEPRWLGPLSWAQLASLAGLLVVFTLMAVNIRRSRQDGTKT